MQLGLTLTLLAIASYYFVSTFLAIRGLHDYLQPGAQFRNSADSIILSFDDGPHPQYTPAILRLLAKHKIHALFFVTGEHATQYPQLIQEINSSGHEIGNHSWSHRWLPLCGRKKIREEIMRCQNTIESIIGKPPRYFRPPYGARDIRVYVEAKSMGLQSILWTRDSRDWLGISSNAIYNRLEKAKLHDIILMHDGNTCAAKLLPALEQWLKNRDNRIKLAKL